MKEVHFFCAPVTLAETVWEFSVSQTCITKFAGVCGECRAFVSQACHHFINTSKAVDDGEPAIDWKAISSMSKLSRISFPLIATKDNRGAEGAGVGTTAFTRLTEGEGTRTDAYSMALQLGVYITDTNTKDKYLPYAFQAWLQCLALTMADFTAAFCRNQLNVGMPHYHSDFFLEWHRLEESLYPGQSPYAVDRSWSLLENQKQPLGTMVANLPHLWSVMTTVLRDKKSEADMRVFLDGLRQQSFDHKEKYTDYQEMYNDLTGSKDDYLLIPEEIRRRLRSAWITQNMQDVETIVRSGFDSDTAAKHITLLHAGHMPQEQDVLLLYMAMSATKATNKRRRSAAATRAPMDPTAESNAYTWVTDHGYHTAHDICARVNVSVIGCRRG
jgi:hypothetical protein